jgi:iron-sulfur cluster repair protein YtfE (RIC family)
MAQDQQEQDRREAQAGSDGRGRANGNDPFARLIQDHREVEQLFEQIKEPEGDERQQLVATLAQSLRLHFVLEEDLVYPLVAEDVEAEMAEEGEIEHGLARDGLQKVEELSPDGPGFEAALEMLAAGIEHHVQDEETEAFPKLREQLDGDEQADLGRRLSEAREQAEADPAGLRPGRKRGKSDGRSNGHASNGSKAARSDGKEPTKKELLEQAKKAGIEHRSSMTKAELADALAKN